MILNEWKIFDSEILKAYNKGWNDCPDGVDKSFLYAKDLLKIAYTIGWNHYILGDDVTSVDSYSDEKILEIIKDTFYGKTEI